MNSGERQLIISIIDLLLNVGVPTAIQAIRNFDISDNPTPEEIRQLSDKLKPASEYWDSQR